MDIKLLPPFFPTEFVDKTYLQLVNSESIS